MAQRAQLKVTKRKLFGKKVKKLRKENILPANIYGKKVKSQAIQVGYKDFSIVYKQLGETSIIDLLVDKSTAPRHTLIRNVQRNPVTDNILHVDFIQVDLKEKIETDVPIKIVGEPQIVKDKKALMLAELSSIVIEAPADKIPEEVVVDVEALKEIGDSIFVKDLKVPGVQIKTGPDQAIVRLADLVVKEKEEPEPVAEEEEEEKEEEKEEKEGEKKDVEEEKKEEEKPIDTAKK
jgi:large subunit ribosomal protein L25